jgi:hypothetical protein
VLPTLGSPALRPTRGPIEAGAAANKQREDRARDLAEIIQQATLRARRLEALQSDRRN